MENNDNFAILAKRLKQIRTEKKMTQKEFAQEMGFTSTTLSAYENNLKKPSLDLMLEVAKKCDISLDWLCGLSDKNERDKREYKTYSDILKTITDIDYFLPLVVSTAKDKIYTDFDFDYLDENGEAVVSGNSASAVEKGIFFVNKGFEPFLEQWGKFKKLLNEGSIDDDIYTACIEKLLRDSNKEIR